MATKSTMGGLRLQPTLATDAQRIARLQALHRRLLTAADRLASGMEKIGERAYEASPADVLALKSAVRESTKLFAGRSNEGNS